MRCYETILVVTRASEHNFTFKALTGYVSFRTLVLFTIEDIQSKKGSWGFNLKESLNTLKQRSEVCERLTLAIMIMVRRVYFLNI